MFLRSNRPVPAWLVALATVIAVGGCQPSAESSPVSEPASVEPEPSSAGSVAPSAAASASSVAPSASADGWERVLSASAPGGALARPVVRGANGYLVAAEEFAQVVEGGPQLGGRRFWRSPDGRSWEEVEPPLATEEWLHALTVTPEGEFVVFVGVPTDEPGMSRTAVRRSGDGATWEEVESGLPDDLQILSVDHGTLGSLLVAATFGGGQNTYGAWLSADGLAWEQVLDLDGGGRWIVANDGGSGDEGFVVPFWVQEGEEFRYLTRASSDGRSWIQSEEGQFGSGEPGFVYDLYVAPVGPDWIVLLNRRDGTVQAFLSEDGLRWREGGTIDRDGDLSSFNPVMGTADGVLYVSTAGVQSFPGGDPGIWTTTDGESWAELELGEPAFLGGVSSSADDDLVVLSVTHTSDDGFAEFGVWVGPGP